MVLGTDKIQVSYRNRRTRQILIEKIPTEKWWRYLYENPASPLFARQLKSGQCPFSPDPDILCSPASGKILVFPKLVDGIRLPVKGVSVCLESLLGSVEETSPFSSRGAALILRLAPPDYHRFYFLDDGHAGEVRPISECCYSDNSTSVSRILDFSHGNRCGITRIDTTHLGPVTYVEIDAHAMASIVQTYTPGAVTRGQEKGYFRFGGSVLVLFFTPDVIRFDEDLVRDSAAGLEVQIQVGEQIGTTVVNSQ
jgi:phosphatidylserine decarboxylase